MAEFAIFAGNTRDFFRANIYDSRDQAMLALELGDSAGR